MSLFRKLVGIFQAAGVALRKRLLGAPAIPFVEDVFSTYLYTGNGSTQTITNGIDLSTKGGLVWLKNRGTVSNHSLHDTTRTPSYQLSSNSTAAQDTVNGDLSSFNSNGFTIGTAGGGNNRTGDIASWTFRKQPKFFDVVTWTGDNASGRTLSHGLGATPAWIIIKRTDTTSNWVVTAIRGIAGEEYYLNLNATTAGTQGTTGPAANGYALIGGGSGPESFNVYSGGSGNSAVNASGGTYVAYLFASNEGGFGLTGTDNVISCGSFTTNASGVATVSLGYEPQWILAKPYSTTGGWLMYDSMRGLTTSGSWQELVANNANEESAAGVPNGGPNATGFVTGGFQSSVSYVYMAIRRGPMKVPTDATKVFSPVNIAVNSSTNETLINTGFVTDLAMVNADKSSYAMTFATDRLRGGKSLQTADTAAEINTATKFEYNNGYVQSLTNAATISWNFSRAPGFFDEVCYTGDGFANNVPHNLSVRPTLLIVKARSATSDWYVCAERDGTTYYQGLGLNSTVAAHNEFPDTGQFTATTFNNSQFRRPAGSSLPVGPTVSAVTYVAYLFATLAGVSKVGTYTGTGTTLQINCGFTAGARFVLIKRTDSTGDWYVWDTARGIISGNDPYLLLNSTAAEVTNTDYIDPLSTGFEISSTAPANINANGGIYIFLAIA